ncbi:MAG TPA: hypothetical protein VKC15_13255 [Gemmatimonadales bacterium]|nr:hypothetical protein [Gemmatimonadales bacterium]
MRILVLILVSAVVAACGDAVRVVKQTIALQEAFFRQIDKRSPTPEIRDRLRALARAGAGDSVQLLVTHGLVRLNDSTLIRRMELMSVMLEGSEESVCAALSRGTPGSGQMTLAMTELEGPALEDWAALLIEAQIASIEARPARHVTQEVLAHSFQTAIAALPDSDETRITQILSKYQVASDRDACWAGRALFKQGAALPEPERSHMALGLVQP